MRNKIEIKQESEPSKKVDRSKSIELLLLSRLRLVGLITFFCAACALGYTYLPQPSEEFSYEEEIIEEIEALNPFVVCLVFVLVGATCLYIWRKKRKLLLISYENKNPK